MVVRVVLRMAHWDSLFPFHVTVLGLVGLVGGRWWLGVRSDKFARESFKNSTDG